MAFHDVLNVPNLNLVGGWTTTQGQSPITSSNGNNYISPLYDFDSNVTLAGPIKSRGAGHLVGACGGCYKHSKGGAGVGPTPHRLGNEESDLLVDATKPKPNMEPQRVTVNDHRHNWAGRAIRTQNLLQVGRGGAPPPSGMPECLGGLTSGVSSLTIQEDECCFVTLTVFYLRIFLCLLSTKNNSMPRGYSSGGE